MATPINDLSYKKLRQLSRILDARPNSELSWQGLIEQLPENFYSSLQVQNFNLLAMRQDTSPAWEILSDMGKRGVTVEQLRYYLDRMDHEEAKAVLDPPGYPELNRQLSTESAYSSFSGRSEPGGGGGGSRGGASTSEVHHRFAESRSSFSQTSNDSLSSVDSGKFSPLSDSPEDYPNHQSGKGTAGPTAPAEEPPPPYSELNSVQIRWSSLPKDFHAILFWTVIVIVIATGFIIKMMP